MARNGLTFWGGTAKQRSHVEDVLSEHRPALPAGSLTSLAEVLGTQIIVEFAGPDADASEADAGDHNNCERAHDSERELNQTRIVILKELSIASFRAALSSGADGVLIESAHPDHLAAVVTSALRHDLLVPRSVWPGPGHQPFDGDLDTASMSMLQHLADGLSTKQIANHLGYSERTARRRISNLCLELGAESPSHLVKVALRRQLVY